MVDASEPVTRRVRALRGRKEEVDPWRPIEVLDERERTATGGLARCVTVFLAGAECPFTCRFCDLWRRTLDRPTPAGALPAQLEAALAAVDPVAGGAVLKLYNASNFFEPRAVPEADLDRLARLAAPFERLVVECHPRLVGEESVAFARALDGRLEVALGLETVHPKVLPRLNKQMALEDFDRAAGFLDRHGIDLRVFVLIGVPWLDSRDSVDWAVVSTAYALERGARVVTLIPLRGGNGELDRLEAKGDFRQPRLDEIETVFERALALGAPGRDAVVLLDLWDLERFAVCSGCRRERIARLGRMNAGGEVEPQIDCSCRDHVAR